MKILGIDYGDQRLGLAIGDLESRAVAPFKILLNSPAIIDEIKKIIIEEEIDKIIIGWPLNLRSEETEQTLKVNNFIRQCRALLKLPVETMDERLTSKLYKNSGRKRVDDLAAMEILKTYLNRLVKQ